MSILRNKLWRIGFLALLLAVPVFNCFAGDDIESPYKDKYGDNIWRVYFNQYNVKTEKTDDARKLCIKDRDENKNSKGNYNCGECQPDIYYDSESKSWKQYDPPASRYVCVDWHGDDGMDGVVDPDGSWDDLIAKGLTSALLAVGRVMRGLIEFFTPNIERVMDWAFQMPPEIKTIWSNLLIVTNTLLVGFAMIVVVLNLVGYQVSNYAFKTFAPKFILAAIGANLSYVLAFLALDLGQMAYSVMLNINTADTASLGIAYIIDYNSYAQLARLSSGTTYGLNQWALFRGALYDLIILTVVLIPIVTIWCAFIVRYVFLMIEVAVAPLAYAAFPIKQDLWKKYWDTFLDHVFMPAKVAFFIAIGVMFKVAYIDMKLSGGTGGNMSTTESQKLWSDNYGGSLFDSLILLAISAVCIFIAAKMAISKTAYMSHFMGAINSVAKMWNKVPTGAISFGIKKGAKAAAGSAKIAAKSVGWASDKTGLTDKIRQAGQGVGQSTVGQYYRDAKQAAGDLWNDPAVQNARDKVGKGVKGTGKWIMGQGGDLGKEIIQSDSALKGAKKVWESWKGNMAGIEEAGALEWGKRIANLGHVANIGTLGITKGTGLDVGGIKAELQLKLDMEISKGVDDKYRDLINYGTRQQLIKEIKTLKGDAIKGDRGAQIAMEKLLHTVEQKHITFFQAGDTEARDLMEVYEEMIDRHEAGQNNMVRTSFAMSTGDRLGTMGAKNPAFSGARLSPDGLGRGFATDNNNKLYQDPAARPVVKLAKVNLDYLKGSNGPSFLRAIANGTVQADGRLNQSIVNVLTDADQCRFFQIPDDTVAAYEEAVRSGNL